MTCRN